MKDVHERACRVCGCTDSRACVTDDGPCFWVEVDLCSACDEAAMAPRAAAAHPGPFVSLGVIVGIVAFAGLAFAAGCVWGI